jgi:hypothetical protein
MHGMGQDVDLGITPFDHLAIHPDQTVTIFVSCHGAPSLSLAQFSNVALITTDPDIKLRQTCDSIHLQTWNVNKADLK